MKYLFLLFLSLGIALPSHAAILSEDNVLVLQPIIADTPFDDFVEAYEEHGRYFLPLETLSGIIGFPIEVDLVNQTAKGWYITKDRKFSLDIAKQQVKAGKHTFSFTSEEVVIKDTDIFVDSTVLAQWFGLDFKVSLRAMTLDIHSKETLPFQNEQARNQRKETLTAQKKLMQDKDYPIVENNYKAADWPFLDVTLNQEYRNTGDTRAASSYSLQSAGDLGYLNTRIFASGSSSPDTAQVFRIKGERKDITGNLLGGMHATEYAIGDIDAAPMPLISQAGLGRGLRVSNRPLGQSITFDSTNFSGDAQPGWEIELYRNDTLLDFQSVGEDGRYRFLNVPVLFGRNNFRLVFYGPQGQIEEETKQVFVDNAALNKGETVYELSVDEKSKDILGLENTPYYAKGIRAVGGVEYGVSDALSLRVGSVKTSLQDGTHDYLTTGLRAGKGTLYGGADIAYDAVTQGFASKFTALTGIKDVNVKLEQRFFDHFTSEERNPLAVLATRQSELDVNSYYRLPLVHDLNIGGNVLYETLDNGVEQTTLSNRLSKSVFGVNITHSLGAVLTDQNRLEGNIGLRGRVKDVLWGGIAYYRLSPEETIDSINLSAQKNLSRDLYLRLGLIKDLNMDGRTYTTSALTWDLHRFRITTQAERDDNGAVFIGTSLNISLGKIPGRNRLHVQSNPMSYSGAVAAEAFLDKNYNKVLDKEDEVLETPAFVVDGRNVKATNGLAYETQLITDRKTTIELDPQALEDPLWAQGVEGYTVIPRAGSITNVQFPVFATSEIDGTVSVIDGQGHSVPLKHGEVQLLDPSGKAVKTVKTEYDGFYLFDKLLPGEYTVAVKKTALDKYGLTQTTKETVIISPESVILSGRDIVLTQ